MSLIFGRLRLSFIHVPIGASDYTANGRPYSYDEMPPGQSDPTLAAFSIAHDERYILPELRTALQIDPGAYVFADPWTPPAWMKANDALDNTADGGALLPQDYRVFARYIVRFLEAYAAQGVPVAAISPANEPGVATAYPGMALTEPEEAQLIASDLAPALRAAKLHPAIYGYDEGWASRTIPFATTLADSAAARDLTGLATHCYFGPPTVIARLHAAHPGLGEIVDECAPGITPFPTAEVVISSLRNWATAINMWDLALNLAGGPVQPPDDGCPICTGLVFVDPRHHLVAPTVDALQLGQLSEFVVPGAVRIASNTFVRYRYPGPGVNIATAGLDDVAFRNPAGSTVLYTFDNGRRPLRFAVDTGVGWFAYRVQPGETATFTWGP
jgi:glucosylceramidase